jgi:hypothetical protein
MPCRPFNHDGPSGPITGIVCGSRVKTWAPCAYCKRPSSRLCDFPVTKDRGVKGTCDAPLCDDCTTRIAGDGDLCRAHAPLWNAALGRPIQQGEKP